MKVLGLICDICWMNHLFLDHPDVRDAGVKAVEAEPTLKAGAKLGVR